MDLNPKARNTAPATILSATKQARGYAADAKASPTEVSSILEQRIRGVQEEAGLAETGRVLSVGYVYSNTGRAQRSQVLGSADCSIYAVMVSRVCTE